MDATVLGGPLKLQILGGTLSDTKTGSSLVIDRQRRVVGRAAGCDLRVEDTRVSAMQFEVFASERGVILRDTGSRNGAWIGKTCVTEICLTGPETIRIGDRLLAFSPTEKTEQALPATFGALRSNSPQMRAVFDDLRKIARTSMNVHLTGETGVGKTMIAEVIHQQSPRAKKPFRTIDCASIPGNLIESALFGHTKGAFTGAIASATSPFIEAEGGTVFVDEIGDLTEPTQKALLRVVDEKLVQPVGSARALKVDVRIITGTLHDLKARVNQKTFRNDLLFRLGQRIEIPPLRERPEDFEMIVEKLLVDLERRELLGRIPARAVDRLRERSWPGNVRELRSVLQFAIASFDDSGDFDLDAAYATSFRSWRDPEFPKAEATSDRSSEGSLDPLANDATLQQVEEAARRRLLERLNVECEGVVSEIARRAKISLPYARRELARLSIRAIAAPPRWMRQKKGTR